MTIPRTEAPATFLLMFLIAVVSLVAIWRKHIFAVCMLHPYSVIRFRQYYRVATSDFVHNDLVHLFLNEVSLYIFCANLEVVLKAGSAYGSWQLLAIFFISGWISNVVYTILNRDVFSFSSAGSSGSALGCLFALMMIAPHGTVVNFSFVGGVENLYTGVIYIVLLLYYRWKRGDEIVNHEIHFYGALGGVVAVLIVCPERIF